MFDGDYEYRKLPLISSELWFYIFSHGVLGGLINRGTYIRGGI